MNSPLATLYMMIALAAGPLWFASSVSGHAGVLPDVGRLSRGLSAVALAPGCRNLLEEWFPMEVRRRVSMYTATNSLFDEATSTILRRYAAARCPTSGVVVAGQVARSEAKAIRVTAGLRVPSGLDGVAL